MSTVNNVNTGQHNHITKPKVIYNVVVACVYPISELYEQMIPPPPVSPYSNLFLSH